MNKYFKLLTCIISFLFSETTFGQSENQIQFYGYQLSKYDKPVMVRQNEYKPYYKFYEEKRQGRVILDEKSKRFSIKWKDGEDWTAKITKKEQKTETQEIYGRVLRTNYSGFWIDDNIECSLVTIKTYEGKCLIVLKTAKVVDDYYSIDVWKKIFTLVTNGECFNDLEKEIGTKQNQIKHNNSNSKNPPAIYKGKKNLYKKL